MFGKMVKFKIGDAEVKIFMPCSPDTPEDDLIREAKQHIFGILEEEGI